ncbi:MAG: iron ABC transporter permease [Oscillospiraceae bacterium]|nr:iron ABC transporter permease [Oscillospiraceae bacterium]
MRGKVALAALLGLAVVVAGVAVGSVYIPPADVLRIISHRALGTALPAGLDSAHISIVWELRLPRVLLAFVVGAALSVSGAVMQSVLRNPLASSYTLGVSSGASLAAAIVILYGFVIPLAGVMTLPLVGFMFGLGTIVLALAFAARVDGQMQNNTVILAGMVFSLFVNAVTTLLISLSREHAARLIFWQMGSFAMRGWQAVAILTPVLLVIGLFVLGKSRELDIMTFGEDQARTMGVRLGRVKWSLLIAAAGLTGSAIPFVGVIGFIDLVAPHLVRRVFGSSHRLVIPLSALTGGAFMVLCDLAARTVISPSELPVGAVTAMIGAPFFVYIYLSGRKAGVNR